jgi:acetyl esterase/lipase
MLRDAPLDLGGDIAEQRVIFEEMMAAIPVPADVTTSSGSLGAIPVVNVEVAGADPERVIFYLHGGAFAIGTAASSVGLASDLARRAGARLVTVDYRLAPEHPQPAAIEDAVSAYRGLLDSGVAAEAGSRAVGVHHYLFTPAGPRRSRDARAQVDRLRRAGRGRDACFAVCTGCRSR